MSVRLPLCAISCLIVVAYVTPNRFNQRIGTLIAQHAADATDIADRKSVSAKVRPRVKRRKWSCFTRHLSFPMATRSYVRSDPELILVARCNLGSSPCAGEKHARSCCGCCIPPPAYLIHGESLCLQKFGGVAHAQFTQHEHRRLAERTLEPLHERRAT